MTDDLLQQLKAAADEVARGRYGLSPQGRASAMTHVTLDAIWPLIEADRAAVRRRAVEEIAEAIEAELNKPDSWRSEGAPRSQGLRRAAMIARFAVALSTPTSNEQP